MKFDATNEDDVALIGKAVAVIPAESRPAICAALHTLHLMRAPLVMRISKGLLKWRFKCSEFDAWLMLYRRLPDHARSLIEQTAQWIVEGVDDTSADTVGGFNQAELAHIAAVLNPVYGWSAGE